MAVTWRTTYMLGGAAFSGLSNGDLTFTNTSSATPMAIASVGKATGKWYWEYTTGNSTNANYQVGVATGRDLRQTSTPASTNGLFWRGDQAIWQGSTSRYAAATVGVAPGNGTVGVAVDCDTGKVWFAKDNSWIMSGDPANGTNPVADPATHSWWFGAMLLFPAVNGYIATSGIFASASLTYAPPSGFSALTDSTDWAGHAAYCDESALAPITFSKLGGRYRISGTIDRLGVPGPYRVCIFDRRTKALLFDTMSDADGTYAFNYLSYIANGFFVVAFDSNATPLNAAIADLATPELMG